MKLSTRSRYGVRMMYEFALHYGKGYTFLRDVSVRQNISEKYLSQLIIPLKSNGLVVSTRGAHGGYSLARHPSAITLFDIVTVLEGTICIVDCVKDPGVCTRVAQCPTRSVWDELDHMIADYLRSIRLDALVEGEDRRHNCVMYYI